MRGKNIDHLMRARVQVERVHDLGDDDEYTKKICSESSEKEKNPSNYRE